METDDGILTLNLEQCSRLSLKNGEGASQILDIARSTKAMFLRHGEKTVPGNPVWEIDSDPLTKMDQKGTFFGLTLSHELLGRSPFEDSRLGSFNPTGDLSFFQNTRTVAFSQNWRDDKSTTFERLARGQLCFAQLLYPWLHPACGWIGELGDNMPSGRTVQKTELKFIFWANFWGLAYVEKFGRKFLLESPGWKKEELDDGGILYVVTESYVQWCTEPPKQVLEYFRAQVPGIKMYRAKSTYD